MAEIKTEPKSSIIPIYGDCVANASDRCTDVKNPECRKLCWPKTDQQVVTVKSEPSSVHHDSHGTVKLATLTTLVKSKTCPDDNLNDATVESGPGMSQENSEKIGKSELSKPTEETQIPPPQITKSRPIQYVIVPSPNGTISKEKLQRFALICKQEVDGNKVSVAIAGPKTPLVSTDGKTQGTVSNSNGILSSKTPTQSGEDPVKIEQVPEALLKAVDSSPIKNNMSAYATILPGTNPTKPEPENRLPGTSLAYRTPGANNMNKNGKIKRPMNAFMVWARTYRSKMAEAFPNTTNSDVSVRLGQVWHEMTDEQKRPYYKEAERIKQRHKMQYPEWSYTPSPARKKPDEPPVETAESVAHSVYWARYGGGSIRAVQQAANQLLTENCALTPGSTLPQSITDQTSKSNPVVSSITNVYKPVPLRVPANIKQEPVPNASPMVQVKTEKVQKAAKHTKGCPLSNKPRNTTESAKTDATCACAEKGQKKRQRKPRVRRQDRERAGDNVSGSLQADYRSQRLSGKCLDTPPPSTDGLLGLENDYPSDPYNPFYFLNLGREFVSQLDPDDVDVDSWRTYLGEKGEQTQPYLHEPDYNLDVFLSEARITGSTTSLASSDIDIVPTPLASTLDRLQKPASGKSKSTRNRSAGGNSKAKSRESRSTKSGRASKTVSNRAGVSRLDTPRPKNSNSMALPTELPPDASDLFVIKEEVVSTTYDRGEPSLPPGQLKDTGGAGDSMVNSLTSKPSPANFGTFPLDKQNEGDFCEAAPTISPPGKKPCVE